LSTILLTGSQRLAKLSLLKQSLSTIKPLYSDKLKLAPTPYPATPFPTTTLADRLFETLCREIVEGEIPAGSKISEPDLARRLEVSRASLREAIARLESCGLVTRRPNVGARVVVLGRQQLLEIYEIRESLEGMAARLAAERMAREEVAELQRLLASDEIEVERSDGENYQRHSGDHDFHYRIVHGSGNQRLIALLTHDLYHLMRMYRSQFVAAGRRGRPALHEHRLIVEAIAAGDGEFAEVMMRRHIRASRQNIEQMLEESP
jgi:DNA-binding GntR family transcriptional regulator